MKKTIWDHLLLLLLISVLILASIGCEYEPYEPYIEPKPPAEVKDYKVSFDIIRHYSNLTINFSELNYYPDCGFDTTSAMADFDLDADIDIFLAPLCTDEDERQPPARFFLNDKGKFIESNILIDNNIGLQSGTRQTIIGDYNGDRIPDLFFASHGGHGYGGGVPSLLLSDGKNFKFSDLNVDLGWYASAASSDIDGDGDLDIVIGGGVSGTFFNNGSGTFTFRPYVMVNYDGNFGVPSFIDIDKDGSDDLIFRNVNEHKIIINDSGIFDYNKAIDVNIPIYFLHDDVSSNIVAIDLDIQDRVFYDIDNDNDLDIISVSIPHDSNTSPMGNFFYVQIFVNDNLSFTDKTKELLDDPFADKYVQWLRLYDLDKDNFIELFDNDAYYREWNGSKFTIK